MAYFHTSMAKNPLTTIKRSNTFWPIILEVPMLIIELMERFSII